jgi:hypothetical protein
MTREEFQSDLHEICRNCADDLEEKGMEVFDKCCEDEIASITERGKYPYRLAKGILCAIVKNGIIDRQWNADGLKKDVKRLRKIEKRYV